MARVGMIRGHNADPLYAHTGDHQIEFFSKAGSLMKQGKKARGTFYGGETTAQALFQPMWLMPGLDNKTLAMQLLFWLRDPRGGAGNRSGFRDSLRWLAQQPATSVDESGAAWIAVNLLRVPEWGRWDDLAELFGTTLEQLVSNVWVEAIMRKDHLACKWAKVDMVPLQRALRINEAGLRKLIVPPRNTVVERAMCAKDWEQVDYSKIPSKAMSMYTKAFKKHDKVRFEEWKAALKRGDKDVKVNASVLFPHDCVNQVHHGDKDVAEAQFKALPDHIGGTDRRIMVLADRSGSMGVPAQGADITRDVICLGLALYCSDRLGVDNPFYRQYLEFHDTPFWVNWHNETFVKACGPGRGFAGSTNLESALDVILKSAQATRTPPEKMITTLLIVSDMQFNQTLDHGNGTVVEQCMARWEAAGYKRPIIVFWNLAGYAGSPAKVDTPNTALVSGFSPAIMKSILSGKEVTAREVMLRAISKYQIEIPLVGESN